MLILFKCTLLIQKDLMEFVEKSTAKLESLKRTIQEFADGKHTSSGDNETNTSSGTRNHLFCIHPISAPGL